MAEKILLLDKNPTHAEALRKRLETEGFDVQYESEVEPLFSDLSHCDYLIIFADEDLQGKAAVELLKNIKTVNALLPIVVVASHLSIQDMVQVANTGISLLMEKPFNVNAFLEVIGHLKKDTENPFVGEVDSNEAHAPRSLIEEGLSDSSTEEELSYLPSFREWKSDWVLDLQQKVAEENCVFLAIHQGAESDLITKQIALWRGLGEKKVQWISASDLTGDGDFFEKITSHSEKPSIIVIDNLLNVQQDIHYYALNSLREGSYDLDDGQPILFVYLLDEKSVHTLEDDFKHELAVYIKMHLVRVPPLRNRLTDLAIYAIRLAKKFAEEAKAPERGHFTPEAISTLLAYDWPRNYCELKEVIGMAVKAAKQSSVTAQQLMNYIKPKNGSSPLKNMKAYLEERQAKYVKEYLEKNNLSEKDFLESCGFAVGTTSSDHLIYPELLDVSKY